MKNIIIILISITTFITNAQSIIVKDFKKNILERWEEDGTDKIEGIYVRSRKLVNCNGLGNCETYNYVDDDDYIISKIYLKNSTNDYLLSKVSNDSVVTLIGTMKEVIGANKYFLSSDTYYFTGLNEKRTFSIDLTNSNELIVEDIIVREGYAKATFSTKYSLVYKPNNLKKQKRKYSGTGFGLFSNGIIATNFHVIDGAETIKVRGINSDFNKTYNAKVLISDKNNDLALIQIDSNSFVALGKIPYTIKTSLADVGENVFVLGYPLRATMGDEIKLTNGITSSRSGYEGDITSYQISAPVQPGNSGGPLFDSKGNLIGIINARHEGAENASYAIKASYLINLIDALARPPSLQTVNSLTNKTLIQQVNVVKEFVYIIETE